MKLVDVIEEGRLVRVPEDYAIREGLMIIRRPEIPLGQRDSEAIDKLKAELVMIEQKLPFEDAWEKACRRRRALGAKRRPPWQTARPPWQA